MTGPTAPDRGGSTANERVETARLILRRPRTADAAAIFAAYAGDVDVTRYLSWPRHLSLEQSRAFLAFSDDEWQRWPAGPYVIEDKRLGRLLGGTGLAFESPWCASTGYVLARDAWGRGYATEALGAMVDVGRRAGVIRLYALCHADHDGSRRVLEKGGFTCEGLLRRHTVFPNSGAAGPEDAHCYARILA
jgi:ribosomal-protein-alanine N-acetyltransferase